jgi:hypothetical protein
LPQPCYVAPFWARVASADMSNIAGIIFAITWYFEHQNSTRFLDYFIFFFILVMTSLCKGLLAPSVVFLSLLPVLLPQKCFLTHINFRFFSALVVNLFFYFLPFFLSQHLQSDGFNQNGLWLVFRENFMRYFRPYDHIEPAYVYFYYLPAYIFPWIILFIPALIQQLRSWKQLTFGARWSLIVFLLLFCFLDLSGSRRNYYTLVLAPFALLVTAHYIRFASARVQRASFWIFAIATTLHLLFFIILQPLSGANKPLTHLANQAKTAIHSPLENWQVVMVDASIKMPFYLRSPHPAIFINPEDFDTQFNNLKKKYPHLLVVTRKEPLMLIEKTLAPFQKIEQPIPKSRLFNRHVDKNPSVIFVVTQQKNLYQKP